MNRYTDILTSRNEAMYLFGCVFSPLRGTPSRDIHLANKTAFWLAYMLGSTTKYIKTGENNQLSTKCLIEKWY